MNETEYSVRNTLRARAEAIGKNVPEDATPEAGDKYMCRQCERTFGQNDNVTNIVVCRACYIGVEAERLFVSDWYGNASVQ